LQHRMNTSQRVVAADLAHGHEGPQAVQVVLLEAVTWQVRLQPLNRAEGFAVRSGRIGTREASDSDHTGGLEGRDYEIAVLSYIDELIDLGGKVPVGVWLVVGKQLGHLRDKRLAGLQVRYIFLQPEADTEHAVLKCSRLVLAVLAQTHKPQAGHAASSWAFKF